MSGNAEVIKEFLVSLGFKTDEVSAKKFANNVAFATGRVQFLVDAVEKAAVKIYEGVNKFVDGMESLHYASVRTNASVENIRAFEFAMEHLGASSQEARASIEGIAKFMRDTPGSEGFIAALGVKTRDANGKLRDTAELMVDLGKKFKEMPWYHAQQYSNILGIDDNTLRVLRSGEFEAGFRKAQQKFANNGFDKAAEQARNFKNQIRDVGAQIEIIGVQVQAALVEKLGPKLEEFVNWMSANGPQIAAGIVRAVEMIIHVIELLTPLFSALFSMLSSADAATNGWSTTIIALIALMKFLGFSVFGVAGSVANLVGGIGKMGFALTGLLAKATALTAAAYAGWEVGTAIWDNLLSGTDIGDKLGEGIAKTLAFFGNKDAQDAIARTAKANGSSGAAPTLGNVPPAGIAATNATVSQKTNINIYGQDAGSIGQVVADEQDRVNSRMVRNMKGAVR